MRNQIQNFSDLFSVTMILAIIILNGCGSSGGSTAGGGIGGTGVIASGSITAKGSITVNGVKYDTSATQISINGVDQSDDINLLPGMAVEVEGEYEIAGSTGTADTVIYEDTVRGPVKNLDPTGPFLTMEVLGQTVIFEDGNTFLYDSIGMPLSDFSTIANGDVIEVSGLRENFETNGPIRVSYAKEEDTPSPSTAYSVLGVVENPSLLQFEIAGLTVQFVSAHGVTAGTYVKVEGTRGNHNESSDILTADSVEAKKPGLSVDDKDDAEIEGIVTNFNSDVTSGSMAVNGQTVAYNAATVFEGGTADELANGIKVEAEGTLASGILAADKIQFKDNIKIRANVDSTGTTITLEGLSGVIIVADSSTEFDGFLPAITDTSGIQLYDHIEVRGREVEDNDDLTRTVLSKQIKLRDRPNTDNERKTDIELQGLYDAFISTPSELQEITILDVAMDTTSILDGNYKNNDGSYLGEVGFITYLNSNNEVVVDMNGSFNLDFSTITWNQAEIEND